MYKVSVIMPIYNDGEYLENSLNSVINQTIGFENIELILIDDKSTDGSRDILENYSKKYSNIKSIFLDENSGCPGIPRNIGIKNATSDYIMFLDADDEYFLEICDKLYNTMILEDADIVICNWLETDNYGTVRGLFSSDEVVFGDEIVYFENGVVWSCIFKKSIILNNFIYFSDLNIGEDTIFIVKYYLYSNKLVCLNDFFGCHHFLRKDSTCVNSLDTRINAIKLYNSLFNLLKNVGGVDYDLNRFFKRNIQASIAKAILLGDKYEIKKILFLLYDFERKINFTGNLPIFFQFINYFILHGNLIVATYICLFISKISKFNLFLKIYRLFSLRKRKS